MVGWHHRLNGHKFEQVPGDGDGQGGLAYCSPWGHKESDTTEQLNNKSKLQTVNKRQGKNALETHTHNRQMRKDSPTDRNTQEKVVGVPALTQAFFFLIMS